MNKTVYKVVYSSRTTDDLFSCSNNRHSIIFRIGKTSVPTIGKIFVFDTLENATNFWMNHSRYMILEGTATNPTKPKYICCGSSSFHVEMFWKLKKNKKTVRFWRLKPVTGTLFANSFTPVKVVKTVSE